MIKQSKIASIEAIGEIETIDIEVDGNRLFYANDILTHNSGYADSDVSITDTSESFGLPATADLMFAVISSEEMEKLNQLVVKQLKNRYNDPNRRKRFVIGVDRSRMKLYDVEDSAQTLMDDTPTFDRTPSGTRMNDDFHEKMKGFK
jgi:hypothetical protein